MAFYFVSTFAIAQTPTKQPALRLSRTKNLHFAKAPFPGFSANVLVFGYGNLSRGDDALGPLLIEYIEKHVYFSGLEIITDFQLQIEHALDLEGRDLVLFVDAAVGCDQPYQFSRLAPEKDRSYTTHAMSPTSVLSVYQDVVHKQPPPCFLLSIQALNFELGTDLSEQARLNLDLAEKFVQQLLGNPELDNWLKFISHTEINC